MRKPWAVAGLDYAVGLSLSSGKALDSGRGSDYSDRMADSGRAAGARRLLAILAFAFWFGGLTFYALVVIPTAHGVLKSHLRVGFITQQVTHWINGAATVALFLLLWEMIATWGNRARRVRLATLLLMALAQVALFVLHPVLDRFLDPQTRDIANPDQFYGLHRVYLIVTTVQWAAALVHLGAWLRAWSPTSPPQPVP